MRMFRFRTPPLRLFLFTINRFDVELTSFRRALVAASSLFEARRLLANELEGGRHSDRLWMKAGYEELGTSVLTNATIVDVVYQ